MVKNLSKISFVIAFVLLVLVQAVGGQSLYEVEIDSRNEAIDLNKTAKKNLEEGSVNNAFDELLHSLSIDSLLRETYLLIYQAWLKDKSYTDTVVCAMDKGKRIFTDDDELCFYRAEIYRHKYQLPEAVLEYTNATNYAKRNGEDFYLVHYYYLNRGNCFFQMEMYDGAIADYNYALKLKSDFAAALNNRAMCYYMQGRKEEACNDWKQALLLGYNLSEKYLNEYCK
ncbi:tetratricopeptide repeat protein [Labilibacter sediminis]|nr:tetratricopeptide repeat protein [Labilibacter sediminis]